MILVMWARHASCFRMALRWHHISLLEPGTEKLLHLTRACLNYSFENGTQFKVSLDPISLRTSTSIWQWRAVLNVTWRAPQRLLGVIHGWSSYLIALVAGSLHLLTQFINSHRLRLLFAISQIFESKKDLLVSFTTFLNVFQFSKILDTLYLLMAFLHSLVHYCLKYLVILVCFAFLFHA